MTKQTDHIPMAAWEFYALCGELLIDPAIALENETLRSALRDEKPYAEIKRIMETEF